MENNLVGGNAEQINIFHSSVVGLPYFSHSQVATIKWAVLINWSFRSGGNKFFSSKASKINNFIRHLRHIGIKTLLETFFSLIIWASS